MLSYLMVQSSLGPLSTEGPVEWGALDSAVRQTEQGVEKEEIRR